MINLSRSHSCQVPDSFDGRGSDGQVEGSLGQGETRAQVADDVVSKYCAVH